MLSKLQRPLCLEYLRHGQRVCITPRELATLRGCSVATLCRERWDGTGVPFKRDPKTARILYAASEVLKYFASLPQYSNTTQYEHSGYDRMAIARAAKQCSDRALTKL
jgi:hypothetical protein